uniref:Odorant-binding protein 23 n=1 Tax=Adelphocoris suturalis TaxID=323751 RepID=A0A166IGR0_9HEMI|nr:odorant-binding protein 23 [Adelphocoris suturalis]
MFAITAALSLLLLNVAIAHPGHFDEDPECRPPHHHRLEEKDCCKIPNLFSNSRDEMHELVHKCFEEAGIKKHGHHDHHGPPPPPGLGLPPPPPPPPKNDSKFDCVEQCFLKNLELINEEGEVKVDELKALIAEKFTGDWASVGSSTIEKCLEKSKTEENDSSKCKAGSKRILICLARESFLSCPASEWTESDVCTAAKDRLEKCPHAPPPMNN